MPSDFVFIPSPTQADFLFSEANICHLIGPMGEGKCLKAGTPVLMFDGSIRPVEGIRPGDQLMGDDSTPRTVLSCSRGHGPLFRVTPIRGESFVCNGDHILCLKRTGEKNVRRGRKVDNNHKGEIVEIALQDYLEKSPTFRSVRKLYRTGVEWPYQPVTIDPYFLGLWLGDGNADNPGITTPDPEVVGYLQDYVSQLPGHKLSCIEYENNAANCYVIRREHAGQTNLIRTYLQDYGLLRNKHIPAPYKVNSRPMRLRLLAGLADADGYVNRTSYQWVCKERRLADDIAYLCRSLGFAAYVTKAAKSIKSLNFTGDYYQVGVSGDLSGVPVRIPRKQCPVRRQIKDVLVSSIKAITPEGPGEYHGFIIDGNHRFLLGDFTVTHNTHSAIAKILWHAERCRLRPLRGAIIRDTLENIKISTALSIQEILKDRAVFKNDFKKLFIKAPYPVEADCFGIDDPTSISKLQGPPYGFIWLEEPAPIHEKANAGLPREVFDMSLSRCGRQTGSIPLTIITQNPADENHWTTSLTDEPEEYLVAEDGTVITKTTFHIKKGENKFLTALQRAVTAAAFKNDAGKWARYVMGQTATVHQGKAVTPNYGPNFHYSQKILPVYPKTECYRGWDGYQHPSCVIAQYNPFGQLVIHDVLDMTGAGVKELIRDKLHPLLAAPKYRDKELAAWRDIGDPSMCTPDQSTNSMTAAKTIEALLKTRFERGPTRWPHRIDPVNQALSRTVNGGRPLIIVSASASPLHRALRGGWHYKVDNNGHRLGELPVKNEHDHHGNAFAYMIDILLPYSPREELRKKQDHAARIEKMKRAASYSTVGLPGYPAPASAIVGGKL